MSNNNLEFAVNHAVNSLRDMRSRMNMANPSMGLDAKRCSAWAEYGYKENLEFEDYYSLFRRGGVAFGAIDKLVNKCWQTNPRIIEGSEDKDAEKATAWEKHLKPALRKGRLWRDFKDADTRRLVGTYSALILHIKDDGEWHEPVKRAAAIDKITVAWANTIKPIDIITDRSSPDFGNPRLWQYKENLNGLNDGSFNDVEIHPDRVFILGDWKGTREAFLEPAFNNFVNIEKVEGGSGESFLKNAARQLSINFDKEVNLKAIADMYGVSIQDLQKRFNEAAEDVNQGNDAILVTQGANVDPIVANAPNPEETYQVNVQSAASAVDIPVKILTGKQDGERASTEDRRYFNDRCNSRREALSFDIQDFIDHLIAIKTIEPVSEYSVIWDNLNQPTAGDKIGNAKSLSEINASAFGYEEVFTADEIRAAAGYAPLEEA